MESGFNRKFVMNLLEIAEDKRKNEHSEALVLRPLLEDRGRITESVRILVFVDRIKHFCFILSTGTRIRIDSVMRFRSPSRGCNTSASDLQLQLQSVNHV